MNMYTYIYFLLDMNTNMNICIYIYMNIYTLISPNKPRELLDSSINEADFLSILSLLYCLLRICTHVFQLIVIAVSA